MLAGAVTATVSERLPEVTEATEGVPGTVDGVPLAGEDGSPLPRALTIWIFSEYAVPFVRPVITSGLAVESDWRAVHVEPPSVDQRSVVAVAPPLLPWVKATVSLPSPGSTEVMVGSNGARDGTPAVAPDSAPDPMRFTARTFTWYVVPFVRDGTVMDVDVDPVEVQVVPSSVEYSYAVREAPPLSPAVTATSNDALPGVTESMVGAEGVVAGVAEVAVLLVPLPCVFTARRRTG